MAGRSWTNYFCAKPADGLMSDNIGWFLSLFEVAVCVFTEVKAEHDAAPNKLANIRINARQLMELPAQWSEKREGTGVDFAPTGRSRSRAETLCASWLEWPDLRMAVRGRTPDC